MTADDERGLAFLREFFPACSTLPPPLDSRLPGDRIHISRQWPPDDFANKTGVVHHNHHGQAQNQPAA